MLRYVSLLWDRSSAHQKYIADCLTQRLPPACWHASLDTHGMRVFCTSVGSSHVEPHLMADSGGVVVGTLFARSTMGSVPACIRDIGATESRRIIDSGGRRLVTHYWGRYVAFICDPISNRNWVIKDPTGRLPCFCAEYHGVHIFFSYMPDCVHLRALRFTVNWQYVRARVALGLVLGPECTGLNEVTELRGGEAIELSPRATTRSCYWNPFEAAQDDVIEDYEHAAVELCATGKACTHAWASCHESVVHKLSGGLDSSIVLGCLADAPSNPEITCITEYSPVTSSDQPRWASLAAGRVRCRHIRRAVYPQVDLGALMHSSPSPNPVTDIGYLLSGSHDREIATNASATAVFDGQGGDSLLGRHSVAHATTDFLCRHPIGYTAFQVARSAALLRGTSVWSELGSAIRNVVNRQNSSVVRGQSFRRLIRTDISPGQNDASFVHPWLWAQSTGLPGTTASLQFMVIPLLFYDPLTDPDQIDLEPVSPLTSLPFVELCLRIPSYVHIAEARDRGLARRAFSQDIPVEIARRQWKDHSPGFAEAVLRCNLPLARELLLDGILVREGLLDRALLNDALSIQPTRSGGFVTEVFDHLITETWLQKWHAAWSASRR